MDINKLLRYTLLICIIFAFIYLMSGQNGVEKFETTVPTGQSPVNASNITDLTQPAILPVSSVLPIPSIPPVNNVMPIETTITMPTAKLNVLDKQSQPPEQNYTNTNQMIDVTKTIEMRTDMNRQTVTNDNILSIAGDDSTFEFGAGLMVENATKSDIDMYDDYINQFVLAEKRTDDITPPSDSEVKKAQDKFIKFRDNVWNPATYIDPVDKINEMLYGSNEDFNKFFAGKKLIDVYNSLSDPSFFDKQKMVLPKYDNVTKVPYYIDNGFGGKFIIDDMMVYDRELVSNGGMFYDGVYPSSLGERGIDKNLAL